MKLKSKKYHVTFYFIYIIIPHHKTRSHVVRGSARNQICHNYLWLQNIPPFTLQAQVKAKIQWRVRNDKRPEPSVSGTFKRPAPPLARKATAAKKMKSPRYESFEGYQGMFVCPSPRGVMGGGAESASHPVFLQPLNRYEYQKWTVPELLFF